MLRFVKECASGQPAEIDAADIDVLYASAHAEDGAGDAGATLSVDQGGSGLEVEIGTPTGDLIEFAAPHQSPGEIRLGPQLRRADIFAPDWSVVVGPPGAEAVIGPDVTITCSDLSVASSSLRIGSRDASDPVIWIAGSVTHSLGDFHLAGADHDRLKIAVENQPQYPWTGFVSTDLVSDEPEEVAIANAFRDLKNLATRFKPGPVAGKAPALPTAIIEVLVARGRVSKEMYGFAGASGLVTRDGRSSLLHPQQFGMNIVDIRSQRLTPEVESFLRDFIESL